jgi:transposase-like protein
LLRLQDFSEDRMNVHKNARLTPIGRERIIRQIESGQTPKAVAQTAGVCPRTVRKWVDRYRREGLAGLRDRSSRPHRLRWPTPASLVEQIEALRRRRHTGKQIAAELRLSPAHRQPHPAAARAQQDRGAGALRTGAALRTRASW